MGGALSTYGSKENQRRSNEEIQRRFDEESALSDAVRQKDPTTLKNLLAEPGANPDITNPIPGIYHTPLEFSALVGGYIQNLAILLQWRKDHNMPLSEEKIQELINYCKEYKKFPELGKKCMIFTDKYAMR